MLSDWKFLLLATITAARVADETQHTRRMSLMMDRQKSAGHIAKGAMRDKHEYRTEADLDAAAGGDTKCQDVTVGRRRTTTAKCEHTCDGEYVHVKTDGKSCN